MKSRTASIIRRSGVVLRGKGAVILKATGNGRRPLIRMEGGGSAVVEKEVPVTDEYVPVNARVLHVGEDAAFKAGDAVRVRRPSPETWILKVGMWQLPGKPGP